MATGPSADVVLLVLAGVAMACWLVGYQVWVRLGRRAGTAPENVPYRRVVRSLAVVEPSLVVALGWLVASLASPSVVGLGPGSLTVRMVALGAVLGVVTAHYPFDAVAVALFVRRRDGSAALDGP